MKLSKFEKYFKNRESLIYLYSIGDLSKDEFIEANFDAIKKLDVKPFRKIDNIKKAIYNYQHYNVMAKFYQKKAHSIPKHNSARKDFLNKANYYYDKKDSVTLHTLKYLDFQGVEAYYIKVKSSFLKKKLFEIVFLEYDDLIMHSINENLLETLVNENVFINEVRESLVSDYINQKY